MFHAPPETNRMILAAPASSWRSITVLSWAFCHNHNTRTARAKRSRKAIHRSWGIVRNARLPIKAECRGVSLSVRGASIIMCSETISPTTSSCRLTWPWEARLRNCVPPVARILVDRAPGQKTTSKPAPDGMMNVLV